MTGKGVSLLLLHAGIADSRMWAPQFASLAASYRMLAPDMPGYGHTSIPVQPFRYNDLLSAIITEAGFMEPWLVGVSFGGRLALEYALEKQSQLSGLVISSPLLPRFADTEALTTFLQQEDSFLQERDLKSATNLNLRMWVSGPKRALDEVDAHLLNSIFQMQLRAFEMQIDHEMKVIEPPIEIESQLSTLSLPCLIVCGDLDHDCVVQSAQFLNQQITSSKLIVIKNSAHLPSMEKSEEFNSELHDFLQGAKTN